MLSAPFLQVFLRQTFTHSIRCTSIQRVFLRNILTIITTINSHCRNKYKCSWYSSFLQSNTQILCPLQVHIKEYLFFGLISRHRMSFSCSMEYNIITLTQHWNLLRNVYSVVILRQQPQSCNIISPFQKRTHILTQEPGSSYE